MLELRKEYFADERDDNLNEIGKGQTYSQVSALSQADPTNTALAGEVQTLFRGETLRGLLLNSYGWWQIGQYAFYAAIGLAIVVIYFRNRGSIEVEDVTLMKG